MAGGTCSFPKKIIYLFIYSETEYYNKMLELQMKYIPICNLDFYFVIFKTLPVDYIISGNVLNINGTESMVPGILEKTILAFKIINDLFDYDFIIRSTVATIINFKETNNFINNLEDADYYIGPFREIKWVDDSCGVNKTHFGINYCVGVFICLTKNLIKQMITDKLDYSLVDDVSIGKYINTLKNVNYIDIDFLVNYSNNSIKLTWLSYSCHYNKEDRNKDVLLMNNLLRLLRLLRLKD